MRSCLLSAVVILALTPALRAEEPPKPRLVTKVFSVAELVTPLSDFHIQPLLPVSTPPEKSEKPKKPTTVDECGEQLVKVVTGMVRPYSWQAMGGAGTASFFDTGCALVVNNTPEVVQEVNDLLEALRRLQDVSVCSEVRLVKVPAGFCGRVGVKSAGDVVLCDRELAMLLEAAQGHTGADVTQYPKVTTFDGQTATVRVGDRRTVVNQIEAARVGGRVVCVPRKRRLISGTRSPSAGDSAPTARPSSCPRS
jgi:hypothetical protein